MATTAGKQALKAGAQGRPGALVESPALQWLWKHLSDVPHPHLLDCGRAKPQTLNLLIQRGAKVYVADVISTIQHVNPMLWDRSQKGPVFLVDDFLAQMPNIPPDSLHAIFCWHLLDLLPREALQPVTDSMTTANAELGAFARAAGPPPLGEMPAAVVPEKDAVYLDGAGASKWPGEPSVEEPVAPEPAWWGM